MEKSKFAELVTFFNDLNVTEEDITSEQERAAGQYAVIATYQYAGKTFRTPKLYYKDINNQKDVNNPDEINQYFGQPVYWLDIERHIWPKGPGEAEVEVTVIKDMVEEGDIAFADFLKSLANNAKNGFLQAITMEGRRNTYGFNLENNNHWHDLIQLIKSIIANNGLPVDKKYFSRIVFEWGKKGIGRTSLSPEFGSRAIVESLYSNVKSYFSTSDIDEITNILTLKKQIILQGPPGTGKTFMAKKIAKALVADEEEMKIIQFHPSYSYEDFVRGITAKSTEGQIEYSVENRVLADFALKANKNYVDSHKDVNELSKEVWIRKVFEDFKDDIVLKMENSNKFELTPSVAITFVENDAFRYTGEWKTSQRMKFDDIIELYLNNITERQGIVKYEKISGLARTHATYFKHVLDKFRAFAAKYTFPKNEITKAPLKQFVLIIDEINRANLPAVLGELIYALEYRGETVDSIYELDGTRKIVLPPNLLIIGTMNTADRSVGHIDYAIRRRFAFVDVLPSLTVIEEVIKDEVLKVKSKLLFESVGKLFSDDNRASDFEAKDVQLGHSYFLANSEEELQLKLKYEIQPILREYLKDGILLPSAKEKIEALYV